jgi:hypothetical protein
MSSGSPVPARIKRSISSPRATVLVAVVAGLIAATAGGALATRSATDRFADVTFEKLGGDSDEILDAIAEKVVDKLASNGGTLESAQNDLVDELAGMAGKKLGNVDPDKLVSDIRGDVVAAGLGKLDGISVDRIVAQVTTALIAQAEGLLSDVDVEALAKATLTDLIKSLNLEKLVKEKIDSIDAEKLVKEAVAEQMGGSGGGSGDPLTDLLAGLMSGGKN